MKRYFTQMLVFVLLLLVASCTQSKEEINNSKEVRDKKFDKISFDISEIIKKHSSDTSGIPLRRELEEYSKSLGNNQNAFFLIDSTKDIGFTEDFEAYTNGEKMTDTAEINFTKRAIILQYRNPHKAEEIQKELQERWMKRKKSTLH